MTGSSPEVSVVARPVRLIGPPPLGESETGRLRSLLAFHGYSSPEADNAKALRAFQQVNRLPATGRLNSPTRRLLNAQRCAHPDRALAPETELARFEASGFTPARIPLAPNELASCEIYVDTDVSPEHPYEIVRARWSRRTLGYCLLGAAPPPLQDIAWNAIRRAFKLWTSARILGLVERPDAALAELRVLWTPGPTLDPTSRDPFYGPGGYVAVGYYPFPQFGELAGDLHFDLSEAWAVTAGQGSLDIETVALHEIGHCLGLGHCRNQGSIMWPVYKELQHMITVEDGQELARQYRDVPA